MCDVISIINISEWVTDCGPEAALTLRQGLRLRNLWEQFVESFVVLQEALRGENTQVFKQYSAERRVTSLGSQVL